MAKVFLIDDDVDLIKMNEVVLKKRGHEVISAYSAAEAQDKTSQEQADIIVLDVMMESRDAGFELAREIHKTYPEMPTIMLTSVHEATGVPYRFEPDESWLPVVKFMDKPVDPAKLADEIEATLKRIAEEKEKEEEQEKMSTSAGQKQFLSSMMILILSISRKSSLKKPVLMSSLPTASGTPRKCLRKRGRTLPSLT